MYNLFMEIDISKVPSSLGVYIWKNKYGKVIYVGKAKDLKYTMNQYLEVNSTPRNKVLLGNIDSFEIFTFENEIDVFAKEKELIEEHDPIFNIKIRPDKIYPYIEVKTGNKLTFTVSKTKKLNKAKYYGPFPDGNIARNIINLWKVIYDINGHEDYKKQKEIISKIDLLYSGNVKEAYTILLAKYKKDKSLEKELDFLRIIDLNTELLYRDGRNVDIINYFVHDDLITITITFIRSGVRGISINITNKLFNPYPATALTSFLTRYYNRNFIPDRILIPEENEWKDEIKIPLVTPEDDIEMKLMEEALVNSEVILMGTAEKFMGRIKEYGHALEFIKTNFDVRANSKLIEMLRITEFDDYNLVTVVQFLEGKPRAKGYRKYVLSKDLSAKQMVEHHINHKRLLHVVESDVLIVEGKEMLDSIKDLFETDYTKSLIAVDTVEGNIIETMINDEGEVMSIEFNSHIYNFVSYIRKELDKFTKGFHRSRNTNIILESKLDKFKYLTDIDKQNLYKAFKSYKRILNTDVSELGRILTITKAYKLSKEKEEV